MQYSDSYYLDHLRKMWADTIDKIVETFQMYETTRFNYHPRKWYFILEVSDPCEDIVWNVPLIIWVPLENQPNKKILYELYSEINSFYLAKNKPSFVPDWMKKKAQ